MPDAQTFTDMKQSAPPTLFTDLMQAWGYGSLGNMQLQKTAAGSEPFANEFAVQAHVQFNMLFHSASPRSRLRALKAIRFTSEGKAERVQRSLHALSEPLGIDLSPVQWALVAELNEEDE